MPTFRYAVGDLVTSATGTLGQVVELVDRDTRWKCHGYRVLRLNTGVGDGHGLTEFWADYLSHTPAPTEWTPSVGGATEHRWALQPAEPGHPLRRHGYWAREVRRVEEATRSAG